MHRIFVLLRGIIALLAVGTAVPGTSWAQRGQAVIYPFDTPHGLPTEDARASMGVSSEYWQTCEDRDRDRLELTIQSCGRVIGARYSREYTGAAHLYRAMLYQDSGRPDLAQEDYDEALRLFSDILRSEPRDPYAHFNRAAVLFRMERYDEALAENDRGLNVRRSRRLGRNSMWGADYLSRPDPDDADLAHGRAQRGSIFFWLGRYNEAVEAYAAATELSPEDAGYQASRCEAETALGANLDRAMRACEESLRLAENNDASPFVARGFLHFMRGNIEAAYADFVSAVEADRTHAPAHYGRGVTAMRLGRQTEGETDIARATHLNPSLVARYANAGLRP